MSSLRYVGNFAFLAVCLLAAFLPNLVYLRLGFHTDDYNFVRSHPVALSSFVRPFDPTFVGWFYRPVFVDWMMAWDRLRPHNPVDLHAASLVLFGLAIYGAGILVGRLTTSVLAAVAAAAFFAFAPHMDEAIWWISSGSTLLAAVFALCAYHAWLSWRQTGRSLFYWLALAFVILAMCSKEDVVTLPLGLFLFDWYLRRKGNIKMTPIRLILLWLPLVLWSVLYLFLDVAAYRHLNAITHYASPAINLWHGINTRTIDTACAVANWSLVLDQFGDPFPKSLSELALFPALFGFLIWRSRRTPLALFATLIALVGALPMPIVLGGIAIGSRFRYIPNLYGAILAGLLLYTALRSRDFLVRSVGWALAINAFLTIYYGYVAYLTFNDAYLLGIGLMGAALVGSYLTMRLFPELRTESFLVAGLAISGLACTALDWNIGLFIVSGMIGGLYGWYKCRDPLTGAALGLLLLFGHKYTLVFILMIWVLWALRERWDQKRSFSPNSSGPEDVRTDRNAVPASYLPPKPVRDKPWIK